MSEYADLFGGVLTLGSQATLLSPETTPMCQLTFRTLPTSERVYFGNSNVTPGGDNSHGYIAPGEYHTWGPFMRGGGIRPAQVFLAGTAGTVVLWSGYPA
jgi:hypothetical protein